MELQSLSCTTNKGTRCQKLDYLSSPMQTAGRVLDETSVEPEFCAYCYRKRLWRAHPTVAKSPGARARTARRIFVLSCDHDRRLPVSRRRLTCVFAPCSGRDLKTSGVLPRFVHPKPDASSGRSLPPVFRELLPAIAASPRHSQIARPPISNCFYCRSTTSPIAPIKPDRDAGARSGRSRHPPGNFKS